MPSPPKKWTKIGSPQEEPKKKKPAPPMHLLLGFPNLPLQAQDLGKQVITARNQEGKEVPMKPELWSRFVQTGIATQPDGTLADTSAYIPFRQAAYAPLMVDTLYSVLGYPTGGFQKDVPVGYASRSYGAKYMHWPGRISFGAGRTDWNTFVNQMTHELAHVAQYEGVPEADGTTRKDRGRGWNLDDPGPIAEAMMKSKGLPGGYGNPDETQADALTDALNMIRATGARINEVGSETGYNRDEIPDLLNNTMQHFIHDQKRKYSEQNKEGKYRERPYSYQPWQLVNAMNFWLDHPKFAEHPARDVWVEAQRRHPGWTALANQNWHER